MSSQSRLVSRKCFAETLKRFFHSHDGATSVEYAVALSGICLAMMATMVVVGTSLNNSFQDSEGKIIRVLAAKEHTPFGP